MKIATLTELKDALQSALDNWDFDACDRYGAEQREALRRALANPEVLCDEENGEMYYEISGKDIWDSLSIYAESTAANIASAKRH